MTITITQPTSMLRTPALHRAIRSNPALTAAFTAEAPQYLTLSEQLDTLIRTARKVQPVRSDDDLAEELTTRLAEGKGVPPDLLKTVANVVDGATAWTRASTLLNAIADRLSQQRDEVIYSRSTPILKHLSEQLAELLEKSQNLRDAPANADEAIATGNVETFRSAQAAQATYATIRQAQQQLARATWEIEFAGDGSWWPVLGYIVEPDRIWSDILEWHSLGYTRDEHGNMRKLTPPWPDLASATALPWLLAHPSVQPWIPTRDQYAAVADRFDLAQSAAAAIVVGRQPKRMSKDAASPIAGLAWALRH